MSKKMQRKVIHEWFASTKGRILQRQETAFLKRSITVSCKQIIVQIGALGWENDFIDCSLYEQFYVIFMYYLALHFFTHIKISK
jgi:hypothetical protein